MEEVTAFVLAGGKSTRMGQDKAFLTLAGQTLLERTLARARAVAGEVRIVGDAAKFEKFGTVVGDVYRDRGPLGGIHAGLISSVTEWNLMLAVDVPFVETAFLAWLVNEARSEKAVVTVPRASGGLQPLCAVYGKSFAEVAQQALEAGRNKIDPLFREVRARIVEEEEIVQLGYSAEMFRNLNTPEEWKRVVSSK